MYFAFYLQLLKIEYFQNRCFRPIQILCPGYTGAFSPPLSLWYCNYIIVFKTEINGKLEKIFRIAFVYGENIVWRRRISRRTIYELFWQKSFGSVLIYDILYYKDINRVYKTDLSSKYCIDNDSTLSLRVYEIICGLRYIICIYIYRSRQLVQNL